MLADDSVLLTHAMDINDEGVITGRAFIKATGERVTYVATPTGAAVAFGERTRARRGSGATVHLPAEALREILHPLGPGLARSSTRESR